MSIPALNQTRTALFEAILDREQTEIPDHYLPSAKAVLIAGPAIVGGLNSLPGNPADNGWKRRAAGYSKQSRVSDRTLWVQRCGSFWIIERTAANQLAQDEALVCAFSNNPIWARTMKVAMRLAEHCDPLPRAAVAARWAPVFYH
jgi:hypothetical protein